MIENVNRALLESLRKGLSGKVPPECISLEAVDPAKEKYISLMNTDFTVEEVGIGGVGGIKSEEMVEKIEPDGVCSDFHLSGQAVQPIINVESPAGTSLVEPNDYKFDHSTNMISFRVPPTIGKSILVRYHLARSIAEIKTLKFALIYSMTIWAKDPLERDEIAMEIIKTVYSQISSLDKQGISMIKPIKGILASLPGDKIKKIRVIDYLVETEIQIELPMPSIDSIQIGKLEN
ncbi:MAG: hypothetical protein M0Q13_04535 [Methanothrix sp.]|jgi:hypothetical protein|nr:hypothetical protein [Methanothrix sp.]